MSSNVFLFSFWSLFSITCHWSVSRCDLLISRSIGSNLSKLVWNFLVTSRKLFLIILARNAISHISDIWKKVTMMKNITIGMATMAHAAFHADLATALKSQSAAAIPIANTKICMIFKLIGHIWKLIDAKIHFLMCLGKTTFITL